MQKLNLIDENLMTSGTCLYDSSPIPLNPKLAFLLGDSDLAIILQQVHYWIHINKQNVEMGLAKVDTYKDGRIWCFQTYEEWEQQFIWMSLSTIKRKVKALEKLGVLIAGDFNQMRIDRTKWYTINYKRLAELTQDLDDKMKAKQSDIENRKLKQKEHNVKQNSTSKTKKAKCQNETMAKCQVGTMAKCQNDTTNNKRLTIQETNLQETTLLPHQEEPEQKKEEDEDILDMYKDYRGIKTLSNQEHNLFRQLLAEHGSARVNAAINVGIRKGRSRTFDYIETVCKNGVYDKPASKSAPAQLVSKNPHFTTTYTHNWNHDELDEMAMDYLEREVYREE